MSLTSLEEARVVIARKVLDSLSAMPGIDVVPAGHERFLNRVPDVGFQFLSKGKSRYVFEIIDPFWANLDLVLKLGGAAQNNLEFQNTERHPEDFPRIYGAFAYGIVAEKATMLDFDDKYLKQNPDVKARIAVFKERYGDIGSNIGFIGDRLVIVDGGVPYRGKN
jgi:hypothetical protein